MPQDSMTKNPNFFRNRKGIGIKAFSRMTLVLLAGALNLVTVESSLAFFEPRPKEPLPVLEPILGAWGDSGGQNVDGLIECGDYLFNNAERSRSFSSGKTRGRQKVVIRYSKNSSPSGKKNYDYPTLLQAAEYWREALRVSPGRLDVYYKLANLYQIMGDFESQYAVLVQSFQYGSRHPGKLRWLQNQNLPDLPKRFIPDSVQEYASYYLDQGEARNLEKARRLSRLTMTFFPNHPAPYNWLAAYFAQVKDWPHSLKYLLIASQKDPQNSLVLCNIGNILAELGKKREARIFYAKVVALNNDPWSSRNARRALTTSKD